MRKHPVVRPTDQVTAVGRVFGTPVVVKGKTWLPLTELIVWGIMAWIAGRRRPERSWRERLSIGALTMPVVLGSEWCHNLAHVAAARLVGRPMDALRITWGMPLVVYYDINDESVTPRQHIARALGGPVFNALALAVAVLLRRRTRTGSVARDVGDAAVGMNGFLCAASLLPMPAIDGGPILKWTLVERGHTPAEADRAVRRVDSVLGVALALGGAVAFKGGRRFLGSLLALFGALALSFGLGIVKE
jgi:Zn-dependent protease